MARICCDAVTILSPSGLGHVCRHAEDLLDDSVRTGVCPPVICPVGEGIEDWSPRAGGIGPPPRIQRLDHAKNVTLDRPERLVKVIACRHSMTRSAVTDSLVSPPR